MSNITKLYLLTVPLEADYKHTLYFNSRSAQETYFKSKRPTGPNISYDDFSYQEKDNKIRVPCQFDEINGKVNYVMYQNTAYSNKWFYAFIVDMKYISDGVTEIYIKTDVMQTWFFDYELKSCFVEREHTDDDTIGKNTIPEGLETGEYICNKTIHDKSMESTCYIVASTVSLTSGADSGLKMYNGVINGWYYYYFNTLDEVEEILSDLAELRTNDSIVSIFIMPKLYVFKGDSNLLIQNHIPKQNYWSEFSEDGFGTNEKIYKPSNVNGYTPFNNKLLTYPYSYLLMDNNSGASAVYHYELFEENAEEENLCDFVMYGAVTPGGSIRLVPLGYAGVDGENNNHGLTGGKFPVCGWQSDYYTNWLTQNALNIEVQRESIELTGLQSALNNSIDTGIGAGSSVGGKNYLGAIGTAAKGLINSYFIGAQQLNQIKGITAMKEIHAFQSPTVSGNLNSGDVNFVRGNIRFSAYQMSIKEEYARIIDNYFSMYGYQTNRVKYPNKNHRSRYWYTKTVGCDISGSIPNEDMQLIKNCYDNGITFWKNPSEVGTYTNQNNELLANPITA